MIRISLRPYYLMGALIAAALAVTASAGLFTADLYRPFLTGELLAGMPVQDSLSLIAAGVLVAAMYWSSRGSARGIVAWAGMLLYALYYYAFFAFDHVFTAYYPLYLAIEGLAAYSLIGLLTGIDVDAFASRVGRQMPVRLIGGVLALSVLIVPVWARMIAQGIAAQQGPAGATVFVLDLSFLIPASVFAAVQVWRRRPIGYLLSGVLLLKATVSGILLTVGTLRQIWLGVGGALEQLAFYIFLAIAGLLATLFYMRNLHDRPEPVDRLDALCKDPSISSAIASRRR